MRPAPPEAVRESQPQAGARRPGSRALHGLPVRRAGEPQQRGHGAQEILHTGQRSGKTHPMAGFVGVPAPDPEPEDHPARRQVSQGRRRKSRLQGGPGGKGHRHPEPNRRRDGQCCAPRLRNSRPRPYRRCSPDPDRRPPPFSPAASTSRSRRPAPATARYTTSNPQTGRLPASCSTAARFGKARHQHPGHIGAGYHPRRGRTRPPPAA